MVETSRLDGPVETCRPAMGVGVPTGARGGAREAGPAASGPAPVVRIDPRQYVERAAIRGLAIQTARSLLLDHVKSLQSTMGLSTADMAGILSEVYAAVFDAAQRTQAPPG